MIKEKRWLKGSLTVEVTLLMVVIMMTIMGVWYLFFFYYNRAWLTAAACEAAVTGAIAGEMEGQDAYYAAAWRGYLLSQGSFMGARNMECRTDLSPLGTVTVTYELDTHGIMVDVNSHLSCKGEAAILHPVRWIRQLKAAGGVIMKAG
ncbi:MAG: pilus assembly protein [Blautia sp.]|nr:pilus assembly protein [Blautia sp.]